MTEYSRMASGQVASNGGSTPVIVPFIPTRIEIFNQTRAAAAAGVTRAWWQVDMGQGAAGLVTTSAGPVDGTSFITAATGTGFTTIQAGQLLQFGPVYQHNAVSGTDFAINKANPAQITTATNHGLVSGQVVIFQNLYQTATTGMPQISGIPFVITVTAPTTFTIPWNTNQSNYTAFNSATSANNVGSFKTVLYPALYAPNVAIVTAITTGATTAITTTSPHNMFVGQEVALRIPTAWGTTQLNSLPNSQTPGSPIYGYVTAAGSSTTLTLNINSTGFTAFNSNQAVASVRGLSFPQVIAVGDVNSGGFPYAGGALYPSPIVFNGSGINPVSTINGPAIVGAFFNATYQGFVIGAGVAGTAADLIDWVAILDDLNT